MQEAYRDEPWALLIGCILFSMVQGKKARPVLEEFLRRWPDYISFINEKLGVLARDLIPMLKPLGLQNRRVDYILRMTSGFMIWRPDLYSAPGGNQVERLEKLHGIGKYGQDSFRIFVMGELVDDVKDKELKKYVEWAKNEDRDRREQEKAQP